MKRHQWRRQPAGVVLDTLKRGFFVFTPIQFKRLAS